VSGDEGVEDAVFVLVAVEDLEGSAGVDGDVVPGGDREGIGVVRGGDVGVGAGEDDQSLTPGPSSWTARGRWVAAIAAESGGPVRMAKEWARMASRRRARSPMRLKAGVYM
jgi:hypothetical protein